jgi:3-hydroxy-9,10-secoandrosta-1,3,5(10)-triene-9,17-dione monooxygenase
VAATSVSPSELVSRARALRRRLLERQEQTERDTRYSQETHAEFLEAGFYRMLIPRMFGGLEVGVETFAKVMIEIARGCPSTGWGLCLASGHALQVGSFFSEQAQADVFGFDGDFRCAAAFAPRDVLTRTEDGWAVEGTFPYASGAPFSTHLLAQAPLPDGPALFVVPRSQWTIVDDWGDTLGLRGSGSNSVNLDGARIPEHFALPGVDLMGMPPGVETPGLRLHGNPMYAHRPAGFYGVEAAAVVVGMARGAVDEYDLQIRTRTTNRPPMVPRTEDPDFQRWLGMAIARVDAAEVMVLGAARHLMETCAGIPEGRPYSLEEDVRVGMIARQALAYAWETVSGELIRTSGTSAVRDGQRFARIVRDMATGWGHLYNAMTDASARELAKARLGSGADRPSE